MIPQYPPPRSVPLSHILPPEPLLLMGAGPVPIPHAVAQANGVVINHLGDTMDKVIDRVRDMSRYVFQTKSDKVMGVAGPSSAAMEMAITNLLWPGKTCLALVNGTFGDRMALMARKVGAQVDVIQAPVGQPIFAAQVEEAYKKKHYDVITLVQGETSCGVINKEVPAIAAISKAHGGLCILDSVCTLSTMPMEMDEWKVDVAVTGGQKGLSSIPGVSLIAFSQDAWEVIEKRNTELPHWCLDAKNSYQFWGNHSYHYTAPVPGILAMHEALRLICEETLEKRFIRHMMSSEALQAGVVAMGLELFVDQPQRLNSVVAIKMPQGYSSYKVRKHMADRFSVEISGAFGLDIIRIGQMGEQCRSHNLMKTMYALGMSFRLEGLDLSLSEGLAAMERKLAENTTHYVP